MLALAAAAHWGYSGLVREYRVGPVSRVIAYVYTYGGMAAVLIVLFTRDSVSALTVFCSSFIAAVMLAGVPLTALGRVKYLRDPQKAREIMQRARWTRGMRIKVR